MVVVNPDEIVWFRERCKLLCEQLIDLYVCIPRVVAEVNEVILIMKDRPEYVVAKAVVEFVI